MGVIIELRRKIQERSVCYTCPRPHDGLSSEWNTLHVRQKNPYADLLHTWLLNPSPVVSIKNHQNVFHVLQDNCVPCCVAPFTALAVILSAIVSYRHLPVSMLAVQNQSTLPNTTPNYKPIIELNATHSRNSTVPFDPKKHLAYSPPEEILRMSDIGYPEDVGVSPIAVSQPFHLFSTEAIEQMRAEIFNPIVMETCGFRSNIAACQLRGYCPK